MGGISKFTKISGVALLTAAFIGGGAFTASTAMADDEPIAPADAPEIMERPWPEYPADGETHNNIWVATTLLNAQTDPDGDPYWDQDATNAWNGEIEEVLLTYQDDKDLGEHGELKEEMWQHFSDIQYQDGVSWGPGNGRDYYDTGDSGPGVYALQSMLIDHGYLDSTQLDGQYGEITKLNVTRFQTDHVCDQVSVSEAACVDGLTGEVTWRALVSADVE
ncbi:MAG TPA: peptidoglycan-binding protein [Nocardiopsis listeri]|uniref:peptidoglycan-binding domain-containing protein n=1 Tax=Nocardiopsis listeri TaxID=53440 RepID=UPI001DA77CCF|nr:peptidoglycan-binding protein [Nocardiopsis listeri]HJE60564.1 peptidoglycan-binding protein [Nocardiopsis listeri]